MLSGGTETTRITTAPTDFNDNPPVRQVIKAFIFYQTLTINHHHYGHAHACPYFPLLHPMRRRAHARFAIKNPIALLH
jgi:hypothetical protein